jgi:Bacterial dnaA protein helix-turn-helix
MSYMQTCLALQRARTERLARLGQRSPDALPPKRKPDVTIIRIDHRGRQLRQPPPPRDVLFVATTPKPPPLIPRKVRASHAMVADILCAVAPEYGLSVSDLLSRTRMAHVVKPRQVAMYLVREIAMWSFAKIGRTMGGYDHTSVMYGHKKVAERMAADPDTSEFIGTLKLRIEDELRHAET